MAQIFLSCGQRPSERDTAEALRNELCSAGFDVYVAVRAQSTEDLNSGIIRQLKRSDYYIFVDFAREDVGGGLARGSLFTNQELAIAHVLGFENVLFFQQSGVKLEGLLRYMGSNATKFDAPGELPALVVAAVAERQWSSHYSRHLSVTRLRCSEVIPYGQIVGRFLYIDVENRRTDVAAFETVARLLAFESNGSGLNPSPIRSPLKVTGSLLAYEQTIWPNDFGAFDLLALDAADPTRVYLNSALDVAPLPPLLTGAGRHILHYAVLARDFPILRFQIELVLSGAFESTSARLIGSENAG
jgi:hypothetical protein